MMTAGGEKTKWPVVWSLCGSVLIRNRIGCDVSCFTAFMTAWESGGLRPLSISTTPSCVRMTPTLEIRGFAAYTKIPSLTFLKCGPRSCAGRDETKIKKETTKRKIVVRKICFILHLLYLCSSKNAILCKASIAPKLEDRSPLR